MVAYRVRNGHDGNDVTVVARSEDGERLTTVATLDESDFGAGGMERPALVRTETGGWRLYVCCAARESKHWWIDALDADESRGSSRRSRGSAFGGDKPHGREGSAGVPGRTGVGRRGSAATRSTSRARRIG